MQESDKWHTIILFDRSICVIEEYVLNAFSYLLTIVGNAFHYFTKTYPAKSEIWLRYIKPVHRGCSKHNIFLITNGNQLRYLQNKS